MTRLKAWLRPKALRRNAPGIALVVASVVVLVLVVSLLGGRGEKFDAPSTALPSSSPSASSSDEIGLTVPRNPTVVILGDAWSTGFGATAPDKTWVARVAETHDWSVTQVPGGLDNGFLSDGQANAGNFIDRLKAMPKDRDVDLVVIQGGLYDATDDDADSMVLNRAVSRVLAMVKKKYPKATRLAIGPLNPYGPEAGGIGAVDSRFGFEAGKARVPYISPTRGQWFGTTKDAVASMVAKAASGWPNNKGHKRFTRGINDELKRLAAIARDRGQ